MSLFHTNMQPFTSPDINWWTEFLWFTCGLLWCFHQLFGLSFWWHPFTEENPLVNKWYIIECIHIFSVESKTFFFIWINKQIHVIHFQQTIPVIFKCTLNMTFGWHFTMTFIPWANNTSKAFTNLSYFYLCINALLNLMANMNWQWTIVFLLTIINTEELIL